MDGKVTSASENKRGEESERHKEIKKTDVREDHKETKGKQKTKEVERELCDKKWIQRDGHKPKTAAEATVTVKKMVYSFNTAFMALSDIALHIS